MTRLTASELRGIFSYDESTGRLMRGDKPAGFRDGRYDRVLVTANGVRSRLSVHRVVWCLVHGQWPEMDIDHKDGDGHNNRLENLRLATVQQNMRNVGPRKDNQLGLKGVRRTPYGKYQARLTISGKEHYLGTFDTADQAYAALSQTAIKVHGAFAHPCLSESSGVPQ